MVGCPAKQEKKLAGSGVTQSDYEMFLCHVVFNVVGSHGHGRALLPTYSEVGNKKKEDEIYIEALEALQKEVIKLGA